MKQKFWYFVHNAIAHPLLILGFEWTDNFHDWSHDMMIGYKPSPIFNSQQNLFNALHDLGIIATQDDMQQVINAHNRDLEENK